MKDTTKRKEKNVARFIENVATNSLMKSTQIKYKFLTFLIKFI